MFFGLFFLFIVIPVVELYILVMAGQHIGLWNTLAIVIITGVVGASFAKSQGTQIIVKIRKALSQGVLPGTELLHGAMILSGGILLLTPGFLTDLLGFSLLIPLTRKFYTDMTITFFKKKFHTSQTQYSSHSDFDSTGSPDEVIIDHPKIKD